MRKNCSKDVSREHRIEILFVFGVFLFYFLWSCTQRYNFSSDESMRYQIPQFIYEYGKLPRGDEPLIRNEDWGDFLCIQSDSLLYGICSFDEGDEPVFHG